MKVKSAFGWSIAIPGWPEADGDHWLSLVVFDTRQEAIQHECWNRGYIKARDTGSYRPWRNTDAAETSRAWKKLYREGYRAVRIEIRAVLFGKDSDWPRSEVERG